MFTAREPFRLRSEERTRLQQLLRFRRVSAGLARRSRALLLLADGRSVRDIQAQTGLSPRRTLHWKQHWRENGLDGLSDAPRAGRLKQLAVVGSPQTGAADTLRPLAFFRPVLPRGIERDNYGISSDYHGISKWRLNSEEIYLRRAGYFARARMD
jgi:hypothetical protein